MKKKLYVAHMYPKYPFEGYLNKGFSRYLYNGFLDI